MRSTETRPTMTLGDDPGLPKAARFIPVLAWMGLIFGLSARSTVPQPPGVSADLASIGGHFGTYLVLGALLWWALGGFAIPDRRRLAIAFLGAVLYGISDEWHQSFVPGRQPDALDVMTDALGAACGIVVIYRASKRWPNLRIW